MLNFYWLALWLTLAACGHERDTEHRESKGASSPSSLAVIGDSVSTGVFASTKIGKWPDKLDDQLESAMKDFKPGKDIKDFLDEFEKIVAEKATEGEVENRYGSTSAAWGLRAALAKSSNNEVTSIESFVAAKFGAGASYFDDALKVLAKSYEKKNQGEPASHVFIMLGGNDYCLERSIKNFTKHFEEGIAATRKLHPKAKIFVAALMPMHEMTTHSCSYDLSLTEAIKLDKVTCDQIRKTYCETLYKNDAKEKLKTYNEVISKVVKSIQQAGDQELRLVEGFQDLKIKEDMLAFDGFHPSIEGQKAISEIFLAAPGL